MNKEEAILELKKIISPHDTIYTNLTHVSKSGLSRCVRFYIINKKENYILKIDFHLALILNLPIDKNYRGLKIKWDGGDMCLKTVENLSYILFGDEELLFQQDL